jgi:hypothetical protein
MHYISLTFLNTVVKTTIRLSTCASGNVSYVKDMHMAGTLPCNGRSENCHLFQPEML